MLVKKSQTRRGVVVGEARMLVGSSVADVNNEIPEREREKCNDLDGYVCSLKKCKSKASIDIVSNPLFSPSFPHPHTNNHEK